MFQLTVFQIQSYMIESQLQRSSQKIKCGNCSQITQNATLYGCCYMLVCQSCFDRLHYLNCNCILSKTQQVQNIQISSYHNKFFRKIECQSCQVNQEIWHCKNCQKSFCEQCYLKIHSKAKYLLHQKSKLKTIKQKQIIDQKYKNLNMTTKHQQLSLCSIHKKPRNIILDLLIVCEDCRANTQISQNKNNFISPSIQKVNSQIILQKFRNILHKSKQQQASQLQNIKTIQLKMKEQYDKMCLSLHQRYQANQKIIEEVKKNIQKEISQNLTLLTRRIIQMESIQNILKHLEHLQNTSIFKTRINYLKQVILKIQKNISEFPFYNLQIKFRQFQYSLQQLLKNFIITRNKTNNGSFLNQKMQNSTNIRASQNCSSMKGSRESSRLSMNRLNSATGKSVSKFKKTEQKEKQTTGKKSVFSCNFNQKNQMCQSYKVNLKKQFRKQNNQNKQIIKEHKRNRSNSFADQINQIQKTQHQQLNFDLNRLTNKNNSTKISEDIKLSFHNNVFQHSKEELMSSKKKQNQPRSNKFLQSSSENQDKSNSISKKKIQKEKENNTKKMYTPSITKLSIKKQLFQDKSKQNLIKTKSSRESNSTNRRNENKSQKNEKQKINNINEALGDNITDFQEMNKEIEEKIKNKIENKKQCPSIYQQSKKKKQIQATMTRSINVEYKQRQPFYSLQQNQPQKKQKDKNSQFESMKQNCGLPKDLLKQNKNKNNSFVQKPKKKSDLLDMRDMMRKPNLIARQNLVDKNIKTKI